MYLRTSPQMGIHVRTCFSSAPIVFQNLCLGSRSVQTKGMLLSAVIWTQPAAAEAVVDSCQSTVKAQEIAQNAAFHVNSYGHKWSR